MKVVETDDRSFGLVGTERLEQSEQVVDRFVLKFQNAEVELGSDKVSASSVKLNRPRATADIGGSQLGGRNAAEKFTSKGFGEEFKLAHLVRTENAGLSLSRKLFEKLPAEGGLAGSRSRADDIEPRTEKLKFIEVDEA